MYLSSWGGPQARREDHRYSFSRIVISAVDSHASFHRARDDNISVCTARRSSESEQRTGTTNSDAGGGQQTDAANRYSKPAQRAPPFCTADYPAPKTDAPRPPQQRITVRISAPSFEQIAPSVRSRSNLSDLRFSERQSSHDPNHPFYEKRKRDNPSKKLGSILCATKNRRDSSRRKPKK